MATRDDLKAFRDMLAEARARVEPLVAAGKTVDEAVAAQPLAGLEARWGKGVFKGSHFTRLVYSGLAKHASKCPVLIAARRLLANLPRNQPRPRPPPAARGRGGRRHAR